MGETKIGFIKSGIACTYVCELYLRAPVLDLGMEHPLPEDLIRRSVDSVDRVFVVE
ncbi:MAG: hypothetical protein GVY29_11185 [Spirochaetes bacterium]|jgi:TPP-dependent indolepyruvate ferredoxin oxidoreductase alpha subunit|nr:hypothetical protein [Spirochaetota bacterium]